MLDSFLFLLYFPVRLYFPLVPDDIGQKVAVKEEESYLSSVSPVSWVGLGYLRNPYRWTNTAEASDHATPSSVESDGLKGLWWKISDSLA